VVRRQHRLQMGPEGAAHLPRVARLVESSGLKASEAKSVAGIVPGWFSRKRTLAGTNRKSGGID
ncbi:hypothetical protein ABTL82_18950, partial [Acinetobacter baumannii]